MEDSPVDIAARKYLEMWNDQYGVVRDKGIVLHACRAALQDIEHWIQGRDPNGAMETAGVENFTRAQLLELYRCLAPSASYFGYTPVTEYLNVT